VHAKVKCTKVLIASVAQVESYERLAAFLYAPPFHVRSRLGKRHCHQSTTLTSLFYKNLY
jgi:hypothetical protein